ncbi:hypothetical protein BCR36DRAFT_306822, partial [Piromyces finnis]
IEKCDITNKYEDYIFINKTICSRVNEKYCLKDFKIMSVPLEHKEYQNLECQTNIVELGYKCCSSFIKIDHTDKIGTWGYENGELCGIPFDTLDIQEDIKNNDIETMLKRNNL